MTHIEIILLSLSLAFFWVEVLKWGHIKPFTCMKCMTGWFAFTLGWYEHGWMAAVPFAIVGVFAGAMWSAVKMRWL